MDVLQIAHLARIDLAKWRSCWPEAWDGEETPHDLASEFFNKAAMVDSTGDVWLSGGDGSWADGNQAAEFLTWLRTEGHYVDI